MNLHRVLKGFMVFLLGLVLNQSIVFASDSPARWMHFFSNSLPLTALSIPGTHDSGALYELNHGTIIESKGSAKCQDYSISDQLNMGVRYLDIRCRHIGNSFAIHHGVVFQHQMFGDVLNACYTFLKNNPTETILMHVKEEHTPENNTRTFYETFKSYSEKWPIFYLGNTIPTLGTARGKIVLLRRFSASTTCGINVTSWQDNTIFSIGNNIRIQDRYHPKNADEKWTTIQNFFTETMNGSTSTLFLNYTSGICCDPILPRIYEVADVINPRLSGNLSESRTRRLGIVAMDFMNKDKSLLVYKNNFYFNNYNPTPAHADPNKAKVYKRYHEFTITPVLMTGDAEYYGHGPKINCIVGMEIVNQNRLDATVYMRAAETGADGGKNTIAAGIRYYTIYTAPAGKKITGIYQDNLSRMGYVSYLSYENDTAQEEKNPTNTDGPVSKFVIYGDKTGDDVGYTKAIVKYKTLVIELANM